MAPQGTVLITGANGTLATALVENLLISHPENPLLLAVRNTSDSDVHTKNLRRISSCRPSTPVHIEPLDLSSLASVRAFTTTVTSLISSGTIPPLAAIVCNAFSWGLNSGIRFTKDGYESTFQVCHLGHFLLVLRLLASMERTGRVIVIGSEEHSDEKPSLISPYRPGIPEKVEELVKPVPEDPKTTFHRGFTRYATAKLCQTMFMYDLGRRLSQDPNLSGITISVLDPGGMPASRCFVEHPAVVKLLMNYVFAPAVYVLRYITDRFRTPWDASTDVADVAVGDLGKESGYYIGRKKIDGSCASRDETLQGVLWRKSVEWARLEKGETILGSTFA
ncbi:NAD(P)-binding protein [Tuber magnatum]|uniref:NAD(P)-binding protein n=1 Tax=Tuber magnatum TaxID=42249 RepID=A0A317SV42_9PEZI|nr:NAD(P)-binding protein [Tuber magnatum]